MPMAEWRLNLKIVRNLVALAALSTTLSAIGQTAGLPSLPAAPAIHLPLNLAQINMGPSSNATQHKGAPTLTRQRAEQMAIRNNPRISASRLLALAQNQVVREARSANLPQAEIATTAVDANDGGRISAGALQASRVFPHAGAGVGLSQLITDFGRVHDLVLAQKLEHQAAQANALATTQEILLATDQAFYNALSAQAILQVARQTVTTRSVTETQVQELTKNKLRSTLDLSIAQVNVSEAKLLEIDAENNAESAMAALDAVLGLDHNQWFHLAISATSPPAPPLNCKRLVQQALNQRPDLQSSEFATQSATTFEHAEHDQLLPTVSLFGTSGIAPVRTNQYYNSNWWGAVGVNLSIPVFNGFLFNAQAKQARFQAEADSESERDLRDRIVRDVRVSWLQAQAAYQKLSVSAQLAKEANMGLALAQTRYALGLSSIVELSQTQLQQTTAQIQATNARYGYRLALADLRFQLGQTP